MFISFCIQSIYWSRGAYLSHISTDLPHLCEEEQAGHPLLGAESGLAREIVQVRDQTLEDVFHALILA